MWNFHLVVIIILSSLFTSCAVRKYKNIPYLPTSEKTDETPSLNVFTPRKTKGKPLPVLLFVHGGNWNSGRKGLYDLLGRNFARKGVVTVIPGYTLSPDANYNDMAMEIASAVAWSKKNIADYGGDANELFLSGHSAGGHLVALVATNPKYNISPDSLSGIILIDAAGLDMHHYLLKKPPTTNSNYLTTWSKNPETWKDASPIFFLSADTPPLMIYLGSKTYSSIRTANNRFLKALKPFQPNVQPIILRKKHIPMITQFLWPWSKRYDEILDFIEEEK